LNTTTSVDAIGRSYPHAAVETTAISRPKAMRHDRNNCPRPRPCPAHSLHRRRNVE
jgi:hypothetical protein